MKNYYRNVQQREMFISFNQMAVRYCCVSNHTLLLEKSVLNMKYVMNGFIGTDIP